VAIFLQNSVVHLFPKCGSTWVQKVLLKNGGDGGVVASHLFPHEVWAAYEREPHRFPYDPRRKPNMIFVRDPSSWLCSFWAQTPEEKGLKPSLQGGQHLTPFNEVYDEYLDVFFDNVLSKIPGYLSYMYENYCQGVVPLRYTANVSHSLAAWLNATGEEIVEPAWLVSERINKRRKFADPPSHCLLDDLEDTERRAYRIHDNAAVLT